MTLLGSRTVLILLIACSIGIGIKESIPIRGGTAVAPYRVNLQTATAAELALLPGIGSKTAERIIIYRELHQIVTPDDLHGVFGIGQKKIDQLRTLTVEQDESQ